MKGRRVCVVGAGPGGLVTAHALRCHGMLPTIFEQSSAVGGLWREDGIIWDGLHTNLSKHTVAFPGFPFTEAAGMFPTAKEVRRYLEDFAQQTGLYECIRFNTQVADIAGDGTSVWTVTVRDTLPLQSQALETDGSIVMEFDYLVVASGIFSKPIRPNIPGLEIFPDVRTVAEYRNPNVFKDKTVVVIGGAFSGAEVSSEIARTSTRCINSISGSSYLLPRHLPPSGVPIDLALYSREGERRSSALAAPSRLANTHSFLHSVAGQSGDLHPLLAVRDYSITPAPNAPNTPSSPGPVFVNIVGEGYAEAIRSGRLEIRPRTVSVDGSKRSVHFDDQTSVTGVDTIVLCTGFKSNLSFLPGHILSVLEHQDEDLLQPLILVHQTYHPTLPSLGFVGLYRAPYFAALYLQAQWLARLWSRRVSPPSPKSMEGWLESSRAVRTQFPRPQFSCSYVAHCNALAGVAGLEPSISLRSQVVNLLDHFDVQLGIQPGTSIERMMDMINKGPFLPCHYCVCEGDMDEVRAAYQTMLEVQALLNRLKQ